jgi:hypothetical protein
MAYPEVFNVMRLELGLAFIAGLLIGGLAYYWNKK